MTAKNDPSPSAVGAGSAKFPLRRLVPLVVVVVISGVVVAMGWHRQLSFETLARHHEALREFIAGHEVAAVAAYVALYVVAVALSIPVGFYLTVIGGILFGAVVGGAAALVGATTGAICIFLIAKSALGEHLVRRAGPLAQKLAQGFRDDAFSYLLFLRLVPIFPFWLVNLVPALCGVRLASFCGGDRARHHPRHLGLRLRRRRARQRDRRAASRLPVLPGRGTPGLPARISHGCGDHAGAARRARHAGRGCAHSGRGEAVAGQVRGRCPSS